MERKRLLVTAGSRGIGAAVCRLAATRGYDVAVNYNTNAEAATAVVADIEAAGGRGVAVRGDLSTEEAIVGLFAEVDERLGPVQALVNNVGGSFNFVGAEGYRLIDLDAERLNLMTAVNFHATVYCCREGAKRMARSQGGQGGVIVNISSIAAVYGGNRNHSLYGPLKGAVDLFSNNIAKELVDEGIRVNVVRPGPTDTDALKIPPRDFVDGVMVGRVPMKRKGLPSEIANAVLFMLSDEASFVTGSAINVAGGMP